MRINTNVTSLSAQRYLNKTKDRQNSALQKLASGERIRRSSDDAAGLGISEKLKTEIRSSRQASRNSSDGVAMIQTAEGGLSEISSILARLRELSVQSATDTLSSEQRSFGNLEYQSLVKEVDRISKSTDFNGTALLDGSSSDVSLQIGTKANPEQNQIIFEPAKLNSTISAIGLDSTGVDTKENALNNLDKLDSALSKVSSSRSILGAFQNRLQSTISNLDKKVENLADANSRIRDADIAEETTNLAKENILAAAGTAVLAQANTSPTDALRLLS